VGHEFGAFAAVVSTASLTSWTTPQTASSTYFHTQ
jgi:hypothetical protein